jgi:lipid-A-disaccharide synthase-like uncharacterized protein
LFELIGIAGIAASMLAYLPQVVHLAREHCSAGVSRRAWAMWVVSSLLIGALALHREDPVFILLQISSLTSAAIILLLAQRYRGMACETHALRPPTPAGSPFPEMGPTPSPDGAERGWARAAGTGSL